MTAFEWLGTLGDGLLKFLPRLIVIRSTQHGVLFRFGRHPRLCRPGLRIWWPLVSDLELIDTAVDTIGLESQTVRTADGRTIGASGWITFKITDPLAALTEYTDYLETLQETAAGVIAQVLSKTTEKDIDKISRALTEEFNRQQALVGLKVVQFSLSHYFEIEYPISTWTN